MNLILLKFSCVAVFGTVCSYLGWSGWLIVLLIVCSVADWLTGSFAAAKNGLWSSHIAKQGIMSKIGMFFAVLTAGIFDFLVHLILINLPMLTLPFSYETLLLPVVCIWYICTELGSLAENAGALGAPLPDFLVKAIALLKESTEEK